MDLSLYEAKLNGAKTLTEGFLSNSEAIINESFSEAFSYRNIQINGVDDDCVFKRTKKSTKLEILLRPYRKITKGMYITFESNNYMVMDFVPNELYPKGEIELCNNTLRWRDDFNNLKEYNCIIKGDSYQINDDDFITMSNAELALYVPSNDDTNSIKASQRFIFGKLAFEVSEIDSFTNIVNGVGYIEMKLKSTSKADTDDTDTGVADETGNSGWGDW